MAAPHDSARAYSADGWLTKTSGARPTEYPRVVIEYCSGCGYEPRFNEAAAFIEEEFSGKIKVEGVLDTQGTGKFEITVGDALVHSKTQRGQGFLDSDEKRKAVFNAIRESAVNPSPLKVTVVEGLVDADGDLKNEEEEDLPEQSNTSLFFSLFTLVLSIPALIGACCWPALVVGLISGTVSSAARTLGHWVSFGLTATLMITVNIFMIRGLKQRYIPEGKGRGCLGRRCHYYGPVIMTMLASPLIMADLCRHVLGDLNVWPWCGDPSVQGGVFGRVNESWTADCFWSSTEYRCTIPCCVPGNNSVETTDNLNMNYLLVDGIQRPFVSDECSCDPSAYPQEFNKACEDYYGEYNATVALKPSEKCVGGNGAYDGPSMRAVFNSDGRVEAFEDDDDAPSSEQFLPPYWPQYRQLSDDELEVVHKEAVKGNPDQDPQDIPKCNCDNCVPAEHETIGHLSFIGVLFTICFTYIGFTLLAVGTLWNADIVKKMGKIKKQWKQIQEQRRRQAASKRSKSRSLQEPLL